MININVTPKWATAARRRRRAPTSLAISTTFAGICSDPVQNGRSGHGERCALVRSGTSRTSSFPHNRSSRRVKTVNGGQKVKAKVKKKYKKTNLSRLSGPAELCELYRPDSGINSFNSLAKVAGRRYVTPWAAQALAGVSDSIATWTSKYLAKVPV